MFCYTVQIRFEFNKNAHGYVQNSASTNAMAVVYCLQLEDIIGQSNYIWSKQQCTKLAKESTVLNEGVNCLDDDDFVFGMLQQYPDQAGLFSVWLREEIKSIQRMSRIIITQHSVAALEKCS